MSAIERKTPTGVEVPGIKESEPVVLWSAYMALDVTEKAFEKAVRDVAEEDGQRYTGFITRDTDGNIASFTRTRYPRRKYGVASLAACERGTAALANRLDTRALSDSQTSGIRVVLGLREGYNITNPSHTIEEVQAALPDVELTAAEVFALRPAGEHDETSIYKEPVVVIQATGNKIPAIYELATDFKQERFSIENFESGLAYMVETIHCTEPDE